MALGDDPAAISHLMMPMYCSFGDLRVPVKLRPGSRLASIYGEAEGVDEILQCNYALEPGFMESVAQGPMQFSAWDKEGAPRALELSEHPFFVAMLFQPELSSTPDAPHPVITQFLAAVRAGARTTI
jgi:CTP synthase (UTP-ammonia lyase)